MMLPRGGGDLERVGFSGSIFSDFTLQSSINRSITVSRYINFLEISSLAGARNSSV